MLANIAQSTYVLDENMSKYFTYPTAVVGQGKICFNFSQADFMFEVDLGNSSALFCDVPQILKPWFRYLSSFFTPSSVHFPFSQTLVRASVRPNNTVGLATISIAAKAVLYVTKSVGAVM
jgi:hypothetical protein